MKNKKGSAAADGDADAFFGAAPAFMHKDQVATEKANCAAAGPWNAYADSDFYGTGVLDVMNRTHMKYEYVHSSDGKVADSFWLTRTD